MSTATSSGASFRDKIATVDTDGKRVWIYPRKPKGRLTRYRKWVSLVFLLLLFALPFCRTEGHPLFLFHVLERRFILFGQIFWPQDFFLFAVGMLLFVVFVALFTVVFGRIFCGWVCPQTIFMELVFRPVEYWIEGDAQQQKRLAAAPWNREKILKKAAKWSLFWLISFVIANTFLAYIIGVDDLYRIITGPVGQHIGGLVAICIFTTVFFLVYAWFREQVCTTVCPYGRLQGVLLDKGSIVVAYDHKRGEPRGKINHEGAGDCVDCKQCIRVCPTGIDIRNGTQLECVNCTACIDACDQIMSAAGRSTGLIRYASEDQIARNRPFRFTVRMKAYTAVMLVLLAVEATLMISRTDVSASILRTPGQLYQEHSKAQWSNLYNYKLVNKTYQDKVVVLEPADFKGSIEIVGDHILRIPKGSSVTGSLFICRDKSTVRERKTDLNINILEDGKKVQSVAVTFLGPFGL